MRIALFQPAYPAEGTMAGADACIRWMQARLEELRPGEQDLVLLPEYANAPGLTHREALRRFAAGPGADFVRDIGAAASRLQSTIVLAVVAQSQGRWFNRTLVFDAEGSIASTYDKLHLTRAERELGLNPGTEPKVIEHGGVRLGFATCFDLYFPEHFEVLAAQHADVVLCPSYQRSESAQRIRLLAQARAFDSGTYLLRSSYSMGDASHGGCSLIATPAGDLLADAGGKVCVLHGELDPRGKCARPASHGQPLVEHRDLIEAHRMPAAYRERGECARRLAAAPFPRLCAHRGLSRPCPENTLPAFAAALAAGAEEIEFDLWLTRDGVAVVCHDETVDRTTTGRGRISEMAWEDVRRLDAGVKHGAAWRGTPVPRLEEVLQSMGGRIGLNIHVKDAGPDGRLVRMVCDELRREALLDTAYLAGGSDAVLRTVCKYAPEVPRACLLGQGGEPCRQVELAQEYGCQRIQFSGQVTGSHIRCAHDAGLICNYFWADDVVQAREYVGKGMDVILTNCAHTMIADGFRAMTMRR